VLSVLAAVVAVLAVWWGCREQKAPLTLSAYHPCVLQHFFVNIYDIQTCRCGCGLEVSFAVPAGRICTSKYGGLELAEGCIVRAQPNKRLAGGSGQSKPKPRTRSLELEPELVPVYTPRNYGAHKPIYSLFHLGIWVILYFVPLPNF
jgi:hypothetical protein